MAMPDCFLPETDQQPDRTRLNLRAWCDAAWLAHSMISHSNDDPRGATGRPGAFALPKAKAALCLRLLANGLVPGSANAVFFFTGANM